MSESDFDAMLWQNVRALIEKYDIHFDGETAVPSDDGLADRAYQAALELFLATGFYCTSTQRAVRFTREEVEEAVRHAKTSYVFGEGRDQHTMRPRVVEDPEPPTCIFSHLGVPVKQDLFPKVCLAQAQEQYADAFCCVSLHDTFRGIPIKSGTSRSRSRRACGTSPSAARRPDWRDGRVWASTRMVSVGESTASIIAASHPAFGALPRDVPQVGAIAELKVDYERMNKVAFQRECGIGLAGLYGPLMGGYAGGPEGTMLVQIAHFFLGLLAFDVEYHICFPIDIHQTCSTTLPMLWLVSVYCQAIARNSQHAQHLHHHGRRRPVDRHALLRDGRTAPSRTRSRARTASRAGSRATSTPSTSSTLELRLGAETAHAVAQVGDDPRPGQRRGEGDPRQVRRRHPERAARQDVQRALRPGARQAAGRLRRHLPEEEGRGVRGSGSTTPCSRSQLE